MNYWKLGCRWGSAEEGKPLFYEMLEKHSIVIGARDQVYSIGDVVALTDGYEVFAIAEVLESPKQSHSHPELEIEFRKYEIDFAEWVTCSKAQIYKLEGDEKFTYKLRQGMSRISQDDVKSKIDSILKKKSNK